METLSPQDHTSSEDPRRAAVSVGPGPEREPDLPKLLRQLERQLDKCRDNIRYVPPTTANAMYTAE